MISKGRIYILINKMAILEVEFNNRICFQRNEKL